MAVDADQALYLAKKAGKDRVERLPAADVQDPRSIAIGQSAQRELS